MSYKKLEIWQIVEGYGRRIYKQDFLRFLTSSIASNDETIDHLENLYHTESLKNKQLDTDLYENLEMLGRKLNNFIHSVQIKHNIASEYDTYYQLSDVENPEP